ncbi:hypothetical protein S83_029184, partial [Arachis hypogaea]
SILVKKYALRALVTSKEWTISTCSKETKAKNFVDQSQCSDIVKLIELLVHMLRIVDSEDKATMNFLYQAFGK